MRCVAIACGEASGDAIGEGLVKAIKSAYPNCQVIGIIGPKMLAAGAEALYTIDDLSVMGISEVLAKLPHILKVRKGLIQQVLDLKPDVFIGIDAPDFNLGVAQKLKAKGIKTVQYVSPSIWAWKGWRVHKIKKSTDLVLCTLPFEPKYYEKVNHKAVFIGHPLASQIDFNLTREDYQNRLGLPVGVNYIAILPGSRKFEVKNLLPTFLVAASLYAKQYPDAKFILPVAKADLTPLITEMIKQAGIDVQLIKGKAVDVLGASSKAMIASGTVVLEAALVGTPSVVAYRLSAFSYFIGKMMVKLKYISLPNIILDKPLFPELIQGDCTAVKLFEALERPFDKLRITPRDLSPETSPEPGKSRCPEPDKSRNPEPVEGCINTSSFTQGINHLRTTLNQNASQNAFNEIQKLCQQ